MPWHHSGADVTRPTNVASGKPYRGINTVSLWAAAYGSGYASGVWGTYRQWQALGAQVRKGEHASLGVLWKEFRAKDDDASDDDGDHRRLFAKAFSLFNADQVDGYAPEPGPVLPESERLAAAEAFIAALGIDTVYGSASAYYHIAEDRITCRISAPSTMPTASTPPIFTRRLMPVAQPIGSTGISAPSGPGTRSPWRKRPPS
jgi:antirestriction protein ArdC